MRPINIPDKVLPGFQAIARLSDEQIRDFASYLDEMPVGTKFDDIHSFLTTRLRIDAAKEIVQTLSSFGELLEPGKVDFKELADSLATTFGHSASYDLASNELDRLRDHLLLIFNHSKSLKQTLKAKRLFFENDNVLTESRIISDLRLVFNDDMEEQMRSALIIHKLHITYRRGRQTDEIYLTLDDDDLRKLKETIDRAMHKEELIRKDHQNDFNII